MRKHRLFLLPKLSPTVISRNPNTLAIPYQHSLANLRRVIIGAEATLVLLLSVPSLTAALIIELLEKVIMIREIHPTHSLVKSPVITQVR